MTEARSEIILLDGGNGHILKQNLVEKLCTGLNYDELFAAGTLANVLQPQIVQKVHENYANLGVDVITTNTFGATKWSLGKIGRENQALDLAVAGAKIAKEVAMQSNHEILVAGSLPPLQESYIPLMDTELDATQSEYQQLATALASFVDILLCETMASIAEAKISSTAASSIPNKPIWISFTLQDNKIGLLRSGERLQDAVRAVRAVPGLQAVLLNCCDPQTVTAGLKILSEALGSDSGIKIGAYANGFKTTTSEWLNQEKSIQDTNVLQLPDDEYDSEGTILPEAYAQHAKQWIEAGATIIGGCCGICPEHIAKIKSELMKS